MSIKIDKIDTSNWEAAIHGMRNPMNSWDKSDSCFKGLFYISGCITLCGGYKHNDSCNKNHFMLGPNDYKRAMNLVKSGSDHGKFMRMITFSCDITAPIYWWKEMDTYKVGTVRNSCSTMHKITAKEFTREDFSYDHLNSSIDTLDSVISALNSLRARYIFIKNTPTKDMAKKQANLKNIWYQIIQLLPSSYNQLATWSANYEVLRNIYHARKYHKLEEWREFRRIIESLPYSELITCEREDRLDRMLKMCEEIASDTGTSIETVIGYMFTAMYTGENGNNGDIGVLRSITEAKLKGEL